MGYIWRILTNADYFQVADIVSKETLSVDLSYLKGKNIFDLNLTQEAANIVRSCPDCSRVSLARIIPNRIFVEFVRRKPIAFIKLYRYFAVDEDGFIFSPAAQPFNQRPLDNETSLPVITGLETKIFGPKLGNRYENKELSVALLVLKEANRSPLLKNYRIQKVNIAGINNITVQIPLKNDSLEIKIGQGNIKEKVAIMAGLINQERQNLDNIKYIDLRFNEPVIKFKDANK